MIADRLRAAILQAAISGKLTDQRPEDGTATELLEQIEAERAALVKAKRLKKQVSLPVLVSDDQPLLVPGNWAWAPLGNLVTVNPDGSASTYGLSEDLWVLDLEDIEKGAGRILQRFTLKERNSLSSKASFLPGDVLYGKLRPYLNKVVVADRPGVCTTEILVLRPSSGINSEYLSRLLRSPHFSDYASAKVYGTKMPRLGTNDLRSRSVPVPPFAEQKRIVAKLDEVLPLIDQLAELEREREHLDREFAKAIERAILQAAISGKLTKQHPEDGTATELLETIKTERQQLEKEGKIKKQKPMPPVGREDEPFELPGTWKWVRLGEIGSWAAGSTPSRSKPEFYGGDIPWVKSGEVKQGRIAVTEETITEDALISCSVRLNPPGSVLVAMYGANIGDTGVLEIAATTNQAVCACIPYVGVDSGFLRYFIGFSKQYLKMQGAGGAQPNISRTKIIDVPFPVPPEFEQERIAAKLDRVLPLVRDLGALVT